MVKQIHYSNSEYVLNAFHIFFFSFHQSQAAFANFGSNHSKWTKLFPGIRSKCTTLSYHMYMPIMREMILSWGMCAASANALTTLLTQSNDPNEKSNRDGYSSNAPVLMVGELNRKFTFNTSHTSHTCNSCNSHISHIPYIPHMQLMHLTVNVKKLQPSHAEEILLVALATNHTNILQLFDVHKDVHFIYIVTELDLGINLYSHITAAPNKKLLVNSACLVFKQLLNAVSYMHSVGYALRCLTIASIKALVDLRDNLSIKIVIYDCASKIGTPNQNMTLFATAYGKPFIAPEVLCNGKKVRFVFLP